MRCVSAAAGLGEASLLLLLASWPVPVLPDVSNFGVAAAYAAAQRKRCAGHPACPKTVSAKVAPRPVWCRHARGAASDALPGVTDPVLPPQMTAFFTCMAKFTDTEDKCAAERRALTNCSTAAVSRSRGRLGGALRGSSVKGEDGASGGAQSGLC